MPRLPRAALRQARTRFSQEQRCAKAGLIVRFSGCTVVGPAANRSPNMPQEMVIFTRTFDLLEWLLPKLERFPRAYRSTLTQRLMDAALDLQEALAAAEARAGRSRLSALRDADAALGRLRIFLRLAHRWRWLSDGQYAHAGGMVGEIGRLLGGWLKSEKA